MKYHHVIHLGLVLAACGSEASMQGELGVAGGSSVRPIFAPEGEERDPILSLVDIELDAGLGTDAAVELDAGMPEADAAVELDAGADAAADAGTSAWPGIEVQCESCGPEGECAGEGNACYEGECVVLAIGGECPPGLLGVSTLPGLVDCLGTLCVCLPETSCDAWLNAYGP
jgi:hypothetical protein